MLMSIYEVPICIYMSSQKYLFSETNKVVTIFLGHSRTMLSHNLNHFWVKSRGRELISSVSSMLKRHHTHSQLKEKKADLATHRLKFLVFNSLITTISLILRIG